MNDKNRRTGRSTRTLFLALSRPEQYIEIVFTTREVARYHFQTFCNMLTDLNFVYKANYNNLTAENFGRTFRFKSADTQHRGMRVGFILEDHEL